MMDYLKGEFNGRPVTGAEIGVFRGEGSLYILENLNVKMLHLIDPYDYEDLQYRDLARPHLAGASRDACERVVPFEDKVTWWRMPSDEVATLIEPGSLDFVYIDGNHAYSYVKRDIANYSKLVKPGGWVGGHDYTVGDVYVDNELFLLDGEPIQFAVKPAVDEYVKQHGLYLFVAGNPVFPDWWFQLPQKLDEEVSVMK